MKQLFAALIAVALTITATVSQAQSQKVSRGQSPTIVQKGSFSNTATTTANATTALTSYAYTLMPFYTSTRTVSGASGVDTMKMQLSGDYNAVTFQWNLTKIGGRVDSFTVTYWASIDGTNYVSLGTATATNTAGTKAYATTINSGAGNPYTHYMLTAACTNAATGSSGSWVGYCVVR